MGIIPETAEDGVLDEQIETPESESPESSEPTRRESAAETVARVYAELEGDGGDNEGTQETEAAQDKPGKVAQPGQQRGKKVADQEFDPELSPPERLKANEKEMFNNLPKGLRRAFHRSIKDLEGNATRAQQELVPKLREYQKLDEVFSPYLAKFHEMGLSKSEVTAQLLGVHEQLQNPATKIAKAKWLLENCQIDPRDLIDGATPQQATSAQSDQYIQELKAEINSLRQQVAPIYNSHVSAIQSQEEQAVAAATTEMFSVKNEKDAAGRYKYPNLHDDNFLQTRAKPLVSALVENTPGLGYGAALRMAHDILTGKQPSAFSQSPQTSLQPSSTQQTRAQSASVSVRGRSAAPSADGSTTDIPYVKGESAAATTRRVFESLSRGF